MPKLLEPTLTRFSLKLRDWPERVDVNLEETPCAILTGLNASGKTLTMRALADFCDLLIDYNQGKFQRFEEMAILAGIESIRVRFEYEWYNDHNPNTPGYDNSKLPWFGWGEWEEEGVFGGREQTNLRRYERRLGKPKNASINAPSRVSSRIIMEFDAKTILDGPNHSRSSPLEPKGSVHVSRRDGIVFDVDQKLRPTASLFSRDWKLEKPPEPGDLLKEEVWSFREEIMDEFRPCTKVDDYFVGSFGPTFGKKDFRGEEWRKALEERAGLKFDCLIEQADEEYYFDDPAREIEFKSHAPTFLKIEEAYTLKEERRREFERSCSLFDTEYFLDESLDDIHQGLVQMHLSRFEDQFSFDLHFLKHYSEYLDLTTEELGGRKHQLPTEEQRRSAMKELADDLDLGPFTDQGDFLLRYSTMMANEEMYEFFSDDYIQFDFTDDEDPFEPDLYSPRVKKIPDEGGGWDMPDPSRGLLLEVSPEFRIYSALLPFLILEDGKLPSHLSSGQKRLISILSQISDSPNGSTILIDEPELSLHIEWQERLVSALTENFPKHKFILATHAPSIVKFHHEKVIQVPPSDEL